MQKKHKQQKKPSSRERAVEKTKVLVAPTCTGTQNRMTRRTTKRPRTTTPSDIVLTKPLILTLVSYGFASLSRTC